MQTARREFLDGEFRQDGYGHQEALNFPDEAVEPQDICVLVICRERFMREAIENSLHNAGLSRIEGVATIRDLSKRRYDCQAFLCIVPSEADTLSEDELRHLDNLHDRNWIVMSHTQNCLVFRRLCDLGANVSAVPFDISGRDLAHLARLAANQHRVLVDEFCETSIAFDPARIASAKLCPKQMELLQQIAAGDSNKTIALRENWSETKVKMQVRALLKKLGVANRTQAAVLAIRSGL